MTVPERDLASFRTYIQGLRTVYMSCLTATGRPGRGPRFMAIVECEECGDYGMTSTKLPIGKRWTCPVCGGARLPVWADGPTPDTEDIYEEWMKGVKKKKELTGIETMVRRGHANFARRLGCSIKRAGDPCPWCDE